MATKVAASIKKTAKAASKSSKVRSVVAAVDHVLPKILDERAEKAARKRAEKKFVGKMVVKTSASKKKSRTKKNVKTTVATLAPTVHDTDQRKAAAVNELKAMVLGGNHDAKREYDTARRTLAGLCKLAKNSMVVRMGTPDLPVTPESHLMWTLPIDRRMHEIVKRVGWLPQQVLARRKREAKLAREISDRLTGKKFAPVGTASLQKQLEELRAQDPPDKALWIKMMTDEHGKSWWEGKDKSAFHGTSTKPASKKRNEDRERSNKSGKAATFGAGMKEKMWQPTDDDRAPTVKVVCMVPDCGKIVRSVKPFESRGMRGMEKADGKIVCLEDFNILVSLSRARIDPTEKAAAVVALIEKGEEPDEKMLASATQPAKKNYAKPVRAHAVLPTGQSSPVSPNLFAAAMLTGNMKKAYLASIGVTEDPVMNAAVVTGNKPAFVAALGESFAPSHNGHGQHNDAVTCMICGENNAPAGPRWQWKVEVHDDLNAFVADPQNSGRVCQVCGPAFFGLSKKLVADQPAALAKLIGSKKLGTATESMKAPEPVKAAAPAHATYYRDDVHMMKPLYEREVSTVPSRASLAAEKNLCPLCQLREAPAEGKMCDECFSAPEDGKKITVKCTECGGTASHYKHFVQEHRGSHKPIWCEACKAKKFGKKASAKVQSATPTSAVALSQDERERVLALAASGEGGLATPSLAVMA